MAGNNAQGRPYSSDPFRGGSAESQFGSGTPWAIAAANYAENQKPKIDPVPLTPMPSEINGVGGASSIQPEIKVATPDLIQITEEGMPLETIADLLFEDIGGTEILNIARHDLINGIDIKYQQISNLAKIETNFGGDNLISLQSPVEQIFNKFALRRYQYVPETTDDPSGLDNQVYLDSSGNLNIELINLTDNMQVEIEFKTASTTDIIY